MDNFRQHPRFSRYKISETGAVLDLESGRVLKQHLAPNGYWRCNVMDDAGRRSPQLVHRLLMETYIPMVPGKPHINHKNGDKADLSLSNMEWCDQAHNVEHAYSMGLNSRSTPVFVWNIYTGEFVGEFRSSRQAALSLGLQPSGVCLVLKTRTQKASRAMAVKTGDYLFKLTSSVTILAEELLPCHILKKGNDIRWASCIAPLCRGVLGISDSTFHKHLQKGLINFGGWEYTHRLISPEEQKHGTRYYGRNGTV